MFKYALNGFWELLLLQMAGFQIETINGVTWYISAMMLSMAILYPMLRKYTNFMKMIGAPLLSILLIGWLCHEYANLRSPFVWTGIVYKGTIRIFAELCLGVVCYQLARHLERISLNTNGRIFIAIVEWIGYFSILIYMQTMQSSRLDYFFLTVWLLCIAISFSGCGIDAEVYNNKIVYCLGRLSMPIYLSHQVSAVSTKRAISLGYCVGAEIWIVYLLTAIVNCLIVIAISALIKKHGYKFLKFVKNYLT